MTQPGTAWRYSLSTDVLGHLVEVISGLPLDRFFTERIFQPLGMKETAFSVPEGELDRFAAIYEPNEDGAAGAQIKQMAGPMTSAFTKPRAFLSGGGGLVSTATDYVRFAQMLLNGGEFNGERLLGRKTVELMATNHVPTSLLPLQISNTISGYGFGLGVSVLMDVAQSGALGSVGEFGWSGAATTRCWIDPREALVGLCLTQFMPSTYYPTTREFKTLMYQALVD